MLWLLIFFLVIIICVLIFFLLKKKPVLQLEEHQNKEKEWIKESSSQKTHIEQLKKELENQKIQYEKQSQEILEREKQNYNERLKEKEQYFEQIQEQQTREFQTKEKFYKEQIHQKTQDFQNKEKDHHENLETIQKQFEKQLDREKQDYNERLKEIEKRYKDRDQYFQQLKTEFENISNQILKNKTENFQKESEKSLGSLLNPLKEEIKRFEERYNKESQERFSLKQEINKIADKSENLTQALKGDTKAQGDLGEFILAKILESSGLRRDKDFIVEAKDLNLKNETGQSRRPDVIVNLPDNRCIVIDSKVSLTHYHNYISARSKEEKQECIKNIVQSLENHIDKLSSKEYHKIGALNTPDFVLMFLPIEGALSLAIQYERHLFNKAWEKSIAIVSPITLYSTLKIINTLWRIDSQNKNAKKIAEESGKLFDKFAGFINDMETTGKSLDKAQKSHEDAFKKLKHGRGNLIDKAQKIKDLGAKTDKSLSYGKEENTLTQDELDKSLPVKEE